MSGYSYQGESVKALVEIYPSSYLDLEYAALPAMLQGAVSGFFAGTPMICGGLDLHTGKFTADCTTLNNNNIWTNSTPLIKERYLASSAMVKNGRGFWILGGIDSTKYIQSSTMLLEDRNCNQNCQHNKWIEGPSMVTPRYGHCSTNVRDSWLVMVTGGNNGTHSLSLVEVYDWNIKEWSTLTPLKQPRQGHTCAQVYTDHEGGVDYFATKHSILTVVVAGGYSLLNSSSPSPVTTVEMLVGDQWTLLPPLPRLKFGLMNLPTSLAWIPGAGLELVGGCWMNYTGSTCQCSQQAWTLTSNVLVNKKEWVAKLGNKLDEMMMPGNTALLIPNNFLRSEKPDPTTTTQEPYQTPLTPQSNLQPEQTSSSKTGTTPPPNTTTNATDLNHNQTQISNSSLMGNLHSYMPGPEFDTTWLVPIKMPMFFMRRFMNMKAMTIDEDEDDDNNFGHFSNEDVLGNEDK